MKLPTLMLGGVPLVAFSGLPDFTCEQLRGSALVRMGNGDAVQMTHWAGKRSGTIGASGWMPAGLDGLDYSQPLELLSRQQESITGPANAVALTSEPRPDHSPWALALVGRDWLKTPCVYEGGIATATPKPGATLYCISWFPKITVFATPPSKGLSTGNGATPHSWSITFEEV